MKTHTKQALVFIVTMIAVFTIPPLLVTYF